MQTYPHYKTAVDLLAASPEGPWRIGRYQIVKSDREDHSFAPYRVLDENGLFLTQRRKLEYACQVVDAYRRQDLADHASDLLAALEKINETIYAAGAPVGSENYFAIRTLAVDAILKARGR